MMTIRLIAACLFLILLPLSSLAADRLGLGPGDQIRVMVYGHPELTLEIQVSDKGAINFPLVGEVTVEGMDTSAVEQKISHALDKGGYIPHATVNVLLEKYVSHQVAVLGQVHNPAKYPIEGAGTLIDALARAGGVTEQAGDQVIVLRRDHGRELKRYEVNLKKLFLSGADPKDPEVAPGDIIFVPRAPVFYIYGEINKPGVYRLEAAMTVQQAISVGGGLTVRGTERGVHVNRQQPDGTVKSVSVKLIDPVQQNDVVYVDESLF